MTQALEITETPAAPVVVQRKYRPAGRFRPGSDMRFM